MPSNSLIFHNNSLYKIPKIIPNIESKNEPELWFKLDGYKFVEYSWVGKQSFIRTRVRTSKLQVMS